VLRNRSSRAGVASASCLLVMLGATAFHPHSTFTTSTRNVTVSPPRTAPTPVPLPPGIEAHVRATGAGVGFPNDYLGLSVEANDVCTLASSSMRNRLVPLLRNLGRGTLRIGGRSADLAHWASHGAGSCGVQVDLAPALVTDVFDLASAAHWNVSWELPLAKYNPGQDAVEAKAIHDLGGKDLVAWSIGNEPNLYVGSGFRPKWWAYPNYIKQWRAVWRAVIKAVPGSNFVGPDACCNLGDFFDSFAIDARPDIKALSMHFYAGSHGNETDGYLLGPTPLLKLKTTADGAWSDARTAGKPLYLTETNTFPDGGKWGVSNTYAATLWMVNLLFEDRVVHITQVDVEQSSKAVYDPITDTGRPSRDSGQPSPVYDAMAFFRRLVPPGTLLLDARVATTANIRAFALRGSSGVLTFVTLNLTDRSRRVEVEGDKSSRSASVYLLQSRKLSAGVRKIQLGGSSISASGQWPQPSATSLSVHQRIARVTLPAYSAGVVTFSSHH